MQRYKVWVLVCVEGLITIATSYEQAEQARTRHIARVQKYHGNDIYQGDDLTIVCESMPLRSIESLIGDEVDASLFEASNDF